MIWRRGLDDGGCEWSSSSNRFQQAYVQGFVDVSGGNVLLRAGPTNNNHLILQGGDISLNGRLFVTKNASLNGNVSLYNNTTPFTVAVGNGTNSIATSTDGINWTGRGTSCFSSFGLGAAYNGSMWVAVGCGTNSIATSTDGINWTGRTGTSIFSSQGRAVAWSGSMWVAVGGGTNTIATSTDGINWTGRGTSIFSSYGYGVSWNGSMWVAAGDGTNGIATSTDGINWTGRGTSIFSSGKAAAYNGSMWVAVGGGTNTIATSTDGINWTGRGTSIFSANGWGVAWNGSLWVAVGQGTNTIATSTNGINWTGRGTNIFPSYGLGVSWNGSLWVAVGEAGTNSIATSTDGINWTGRTGTSIFSASGYGVASSTVSTVSLALDNTTPNQLNVGGALTVGGAMTVGGAINAGGSILYANSNISGYIPSGLNYYEEYSGTANLSANNGATFNVSTNSIKFVRVGKTITCTACFGVSVFTSNCNHIIVSNIPSRFRPVFTTADACIWTGYSTDNTTQPCLVYWDGGSGCFRIYRTLSDWTNASSWFTGTAFYTNFSISYAL